MPYSITIRRVFCASHQLRLGDGSLEPLHGHNWRVRVVVSRLDGGLDEIGTVHDFHDLEARLDALLAPFQNRHLNDTDAFRQTNPTAELVAGHIGTGLRLPEALRVVEVEVTEAEGCSARWYGGQVPGQGD